MKNIRNWSLRAALAVLAVTAASLLVGSQASAGGGCRGTPVTEARGVAVDLEGACFTPTLLRVNIGNTVTWTNRSDLPHNVAGANSSWGDYTELAQGDSVSHQFTASGVYPYFCLLHPGMIGAVVVGDGGSPAGVSLAGISGGVQPSAAVDASTASGNDTNHVRLYAVVVAAVAIVAATGGFVLGGRGPRG